jgi:cobalt/nickel transport system permease protein
MDIAAVDRSANAGSSLLHRSSASAKLAAVALLLVAVVASTNSMLLASVALALVSAALLARIPMRTFVTLALYPALFAGIFAFASAPTLLFAATVVLKAVAAALGAILLVMSTPYPAIFSRVQTFVPGLAGDSLLMTYRTFFLLAERFNNLVTAIRLRSSSRGRGSRAVLVRSVSSALGNTMLYAFDLAQRDYDVLQLRGYTGRLRSAPPARRSYGSDLSVLVIAAAVAATALLWRYGYQRLNPFSWLPLSVTAALLIFSAMWRWLK